MKYFKTAMMLLLVFSAAARGEQTFFQKLNRIEIDFGSEEPVKLDKKLRKDIEKFIGESDAVPPQDFLRNRELVHAAKIYIGFCGGFPAKTKNKLFLKSMDIVLRYGLRGEMKSTGYDKPKAIQLRLALQKKFPDRNIHDVAVNEEILDLCPYDADSVWNLLGTYRYKNQREKYNDLMLWTIREDQVEFDFFFEPPDDFGPLVSEYFLFFIQVNFPGFKILLTGEEVAFVAEAVLAKHKRLFDLTDRYYQTEAVEYEERKEDAVRSLAVLYSLAEYFDMTEIMDRLKREFFDRDDIKEIAGWIKNDDRYAPILDKILK